MNIRWLEDAVQDLQSLHDYIQHDNQAAANRLVKNLLHNINLLPDHPGMGRPGRVSQTRELVITGTPYIIPYRIKNNTIEILRILHGAMEWPQAM